MLTPLCRLHFSDWYISQELHTFALGELVVCWPEGEKRQ